MAKKTNAPPLNPANFPKFDHRIEREGNVVNIYINFGEGGSAGGTGLPDNKSTGTGTPDNKATGTGRPDNKASGTGEVDK